MLDYVRKLNISQCSILCLRKSAGDVHSNPHSQIPINSHFNAMSCKHQRSENIYEISIFPSLLHAWLI